MTDPLQTPLNYERLPAETITTDMLDIIDYAYAGQRDIEIIIQQPEFTSICPMTGLPDFGSITLTYTPDQKIVELKSLKFYFLQYRNVGIFYEHLVNQILNDLVPRLKPKKMNISGDFTSRGGDYHQGVSFSSEALAMIKKLRCRAGRPWIPWGLCVLLALVVIVGCRSMSQRIEETTETIQQTTKKTIQKLSFSTEHLRKLVAVAPFRNLSSLKGQDLELHFQTQMIESLKKECPKVILVMADDSGAPPFLKDMPRKEDGQIDGFTLAQWSREYGLNVVLNGELVDVRSDQAREGFMWFRETKVFMQIQIMGQAFNPETGAKYFDENLVKEVQLEDIDMDMPQPSFTFNIEELKMLLAKVGREMGENICLTLNDHPWVGYIVAAVGEDQFLLTAGENVGLKEGDILEVFDSTKHIESAAGERFFIPGHKVGELKIVELRANSSKAAVVKGGNIKVGCTITHK